MVRSPSAALARLLALAGLVLAALLIAPRLHAGPLQDLATKAKPAVVLLSVTDVTGQKGSGTGFFVGADGRIMTNHHVIDGAAKVTASLPDGRKIDAIGVVASDPEKDLAIVKIPGDGFPTLTLGESKSLRVGDEVVVIGSPLGLSTTLSVGIVSAIRSGKEQLFERDDPRAAEAAKIGSWGIQVTAAISPGSSGSPIMNTAGDVVAVAVGRLVGGDSLNFGIAIEDAKALLEKAGHDVTPKPFAAQSSSRTNLIISAVFFLSLTLAYFGWRRFDQRARRRDKPSASLRH
ncbi:MAG: trypsin-like peptidase domain-containing protein [Deltaproteobacteria bacterium]|nr:trypsin-like peptidase domain-containing protein [Deltaproteobacteria bacterium]